MCNDREPINWVYFCTQEHNDGDCRKTEHHAKHVHTGEVKTLDYSPYDEMPAKVFCAFVSLGFPPRPDNGPWSDEAILRAAVGDQVSA